MEIKEIVKKYRDGKLNNETDEKYACGFWDFAGNIADNVIDIDVYADSNSKIGKEKESVREKIQTEIYYSLTELFRLLIDIRDDEVIETITIGNKKYKVENNIVKNEEVE